MSKKLSLSKLLKNKSLFKNGDEDFKKEIEKLQQKMLRIQQGVWHDKDRVIIMFEGFDAAGKGGAIRKLTEMLDPRGFRVHPIGAPTEEEKGKHWLYRFWRDLPEPGSIAIFDRSWYGRVLVERVDKLTKEKVWKRSFEEINQFEAMLQNDGIHLIKIFLGITKDEQLKRFEERLTNVNKHWKIGPDDIRARKKWSDYVEAVDDLFQKTNSKSAPWHLIAANDKPFTRHQVLKIVTNNLEELEERLEKSSAESELDYKAELKKLV